MELFIERSTKIVIAWRKAARYLWHIPKRTHCDLLYLICEETPLEIQLHQRFLRHIHKMVHSKNTLVRICGKLVQQGSRSNIGKSFNHILYTYNINRENVLFQDCITFSRVYINASDANEAMMANACVIRELCDVRDQRLDFILDPEEVTLLIETLCTE